MRRRPTMLLVFIELVLLAVFKIVDDVFGFWGFAMVAAVAAVVEAAIVRRTPACAGAG